MTTGYSESNLLHQLRNLIESAEARTNAGQLAEAGAHCRDAGAVMLRLTTLCEGRPDLQAQAEPLFDRLKGTVDRLGRLEKNARSGRTAAALDEQAEMSEAMPDENPFAESNVLKSFGEQKALLSHMKAREKAMDDLAKDMIALEEIFSELNKMVNEQGESIDLIEDQVNEVEVQVVNGEAQLEKAVKNRRSSRKKKIIIIVIVVAAVLVLALILYLVLSRVL